jgi:anhydro-N-acetylmuramic acid kinase
VSIAIGVMSGTSMDAVDTAMVDFSGATPTVVASHSQPWPPTLRERLNSFAAGSPLNADALATLDVETGWFLADTIRQLLANSRCPAENVAAIGCHGQTVAHLADAEIPATLQLGDANVIAERTGITTINDFRRRDLAAGGQGAPLAPAFHEAVFRTPAECRVVLNLGGIANITILPADPNKAATGFDTGPANCLMDGWARQYLGRPCDENGAWAASAEADPQLLATMMADPYFARQLPKSTGTQYFSARWLREQLANCAKRPPAEVVQATLAQLTSRSIAEAVHRHAMDAERLLVCGGGVHNTVLLDLLRRQTGLAVESTAQYGIDPDWVEAMAFAWLAQRTLDDLPGNLPAVTGAVGPRILGAIHPA